MTTQQMILIRGLPGSGKSTLAKSIANWDEGFLHVETDMFFNDEDGLYHFNPSKLQEAHEWCRDRAMRMLKDGRSVIVSNTFSQRWEIQPYFDIAKRFDIVPQIILCQGRFKSIHNVPDQVISRMAERFEFDIQF